jgi:hypothetical protein
MQVAWATAIVMTALTIIAAWQWREAARQRDVAKVERDKATAADHEAVEALKRASAARHSAAESLNEAIKSAVERRREANERMKAQAMQSLFIANLAQRQRAAGDNATALALAIEATDTFYMPESERALDSAWRGLRERVVLIGNAFRAAVYSPDGKRIVTASANKTARLWDAETHNPIGEPLRGHENMVTSVAFSPDGTRIITASADNTARLWDAGTGNPIGEPLAGHDDVVYSAVRRSAPTGSASSPRRLTERRGCGTPRPASS